MMSSADGSDKISATDIFGTRGDFAAMNQARFESEIVQYLFSRYKIPTATRRDMLDRLAESRDRKDITRVTVEDFCRTFDDFPVFLSCRYLPKIAENSPVSKLFTDFAGRRFASAYADMEDGHGDLVGVKPLGLVFHWPYIRGGKALVLHNRHLVTDTPGVRTVWSSPDGAMTLVLETLTTLLDGIDAESGNRYGWQPAIDA